MKKHELIENVHYYIEDGKWVFTEEYHLIRGYCCNNKCRHCPYKTTNMNFGQAIEALKEGKKVARNGWNGKGMFLLLAGGYSIPKDKLRPGTHITAEFLESQGVDEMVIIPHIDMWTAQKTYLSGWLASQSDMLADDWMIV